MENNFNLFISACFAVRCVIRQEERISMIETYINRLCALLAKKP